MNTDMVGMKSRHIGVVTDAVTGLGRTKCPDEPAVPLCCMGCS
jgi:hypothetical protein